MILKYGIRIVGQVHKVEIYILRDWIANNTCVMNRGIQRTSIPKQNPHVESGLKKCSISTPM
jgi:hypothetical protein